MTVDGDPEPTAGPLADAGLLEFASIYDAMKKVSMGRMSPRDVDDLEIWEVAVYLGVGDELGSSETESKPVRGSRDDFRARAMERNRQRFLASQGKAPMPEAAPVRTDVLAQRPA